MLSLSSPYDTRLRARLVFTTGSDPFQALLKLGTRSDSTHAAIGIGDQLLHAYEDGVILEPRSEWFDRAEQRLCAEFWVLPDVTHGLHVALQHVGDKYDVIGIIKAALLRALDLCASPVRDLGPVANDAHTCACFAMLLDPFGIQIPEWRSIDRDRKSVV